MKRLRRRPMRTRFTILAIVGLLCSQLVLAEHPLCSTAAMAMSEQSMALTGVVDSCHHQRTPRTGLLSTDPTPHPGLPPPVPWHRPSAHPAALLLI